MPETKSLAVGLELFGLDLRQPIEVDIAQELRDLLADHQLLMFRGQDLAAEDQIRVLQIFGNVLDEKGDGKFHQYVSGYETAIAPGRLLFHSDNHHTQVPLECLSLYAEAVDGAATPTLFCDSVAAFKRLPDDLRQRLADAETVTMTFLSSRAFGHSILCLG
jgi:taurine dioxygenase